MRNRHLSRTADVRTCFRALLQRADPRTEVPPLGILPFRRNEPRLTFIVSSKFATDGGSPRSGAERQLTGARLPLPF